MKTERKRTVFVDIEAAGLKPTAAIIEMAAVAVDSGDYREVETIEMKIAFSMKDANVRSLGINKFSPSIWEQYAIPAKDAAEKFAGFLRRHNTTTGISKKGKPYRLAELAAHNAAFDSWMLERWYKRHGVYLPATKRSLCTEQLARWFFNQNQGLTPPDNYKLETLADYFSLQNRPNHSALADVRSTVELAKTIAAFNRVTSTSQAA